MSKLDGNDRWNSKLLLTEHHEQYEEDHAAPQASGHPSAEELRMIRDVIVLPHMLTMVQRGMEECERSANLLNRLTLTGAQVLLNLITRDLHELRREMSSRRIRLLNVDEQVDLVIYHRYVCRGYEERFGIVREVLRSEISVQLARYMGEIARQLRLLDSKEMRAARRSPVAPGGIP
ncbi:hypothetical protein [Cohnella sp. JJ-181]|uniref:hypothetical protein n=1 Tax=Cohnella rhizoplanae TaxID=2974897 RepID=UPI0022FF9360|nr:hypothetical protein [Cohnella sp. JJ-181]CAI6023831.1 hypothetical protein COHCIP112018_00424 [Cohnella sp. JJ-181]